MSAYNDVDGAQLVGTIGKTCSTESFILGLLGVKILGKKPSTLDWLWSCENISNF